MKLEWRECVGFPGYEVSNYGEVRSYWIVGARARIGTVPRLLKLHVHRNAGHLFLHLSRFAASGKKEYKICYVHRLVLEAFVGPCPTSPPNMEACHGPDHSPINNRVDNLRWDTRKNNQLDRVAAGTSNRGERQGSSVLKTLDIKLMTLLFFLGLNDTDTAAFFTVNRRHVNDIRNGKRWQHVTGFGG
jgi:hypothetical protein